jgi:hypothetical protein
MASFRTTFALLGILLITPPWQVRAAASAAPTDELKDLQARFDRENNCVHKAKMLSKLGDAQFAVIHEAEKAENYNLAAETLEKYRDNVRAALEVLRKQHPDADRQSNGYRQLEMHLGRGIREVNDALLTSPPELLPPLRLVREDLIAMDAELLRLLFPKRTNPKLDPKPESKPAPKEMHP